MRELRLALRALRHSPGFTAVAVLSLGLGIGVNTTIFSVVNTLLLRPLPVTDPGELVEVFTSTGNEEFPDSTSSYLDYLDLRDRNEVFDGVVAHSMAMASLQSDGPPQSVMLEVVSGNFFDVLGVRPRLGRAFGPDEDVTEGTHPVLVLSHGYWQRQFGSDPAVVGREVRLNTTPYTVIGVAPPGFTGMLPAIAANLWVPLAMSENLNPIGINDVEPSPVGDTRLEKRGSRWLFVKGRLSDGVTLDQAQANASVIMAQIEAAHPQTNERRGAHLLPASGVRFHPMIDSMLAPVAGLLLGVVGLVLLVACANVANMLLARASGRRREIALRLALGASRGRLVRQLLCESFVLAAAGGAFGLLVAFWATRLVARLDAFASLSLSFDLALDARVFTFALLASLLTGLTFGLVPAMRASRPQLVSAIKNGEVSTQIGRQRFGLRDALVVAQIAVSLLLIVATTLMLRGLQAATDIDVGFDADQTALQEMSLDMIGYDELQALDFQRRLLARVRALPEVDSAAFVRRLPLTANLSITGIYIPGVHEGGDEDGYATDETYVGPGYFGTMGVPILAGREFSEQDTPESPLVAIVNQAMAEQFWPGEEVIGKSFHTQGLDGPQYTVVGLSGNHKVRTVGEEPRPYVHLAFGQRPSTYAILVARTAGDAQQLAATLRRELVAMAPELVSGESTMRESVDVTLLPVRLGSRLLGGFSLLALSLAVVGLYGVIAYGVNRRVREIGIRIALGCSTRQVVSEVLRRGMVLAIAGIVVGAAGAAALSGLLRSVLYGISGLDPIAFGGGIALLLLAASVAYWVPARRAARTDPMTALRND